MTDFDFKLNPLNKPATELLIDDTFLEIKGNIIFVVGPYIGKTPLVMGIGIVDHCDIIETGNDSYRFNHRS